MPATTTLHPLLHPSPAATPVPPPAPSAQSLVPIESVAASRARLIGADFLPTAALALNLILKAYINANSAEPPAPAGGYPAAPGVDVPPATSVAQPSADAPAPRPPSHTTAYRAASLIYRIARFHPGAPAQRSRPIPGEREPRAGVTQRVFPDEPEARARVSDGAATTQEHQSPGPATASAEHLGPPPERISAPLDTRSPVASPSPDPARPLPDFSSVEHFLSHLEQLLASETPDNPITVPEEALAALAALASGTPPGPAS
jgi:hypothetical protein